MEQSKKQTQRRNITCCDTHGWSTPSAALESRPHGHNTRRTRDINMLYTNDTSASQYEVKQHLRDERESSGGWRMRERNVVGVVDNRKMILRSNQYEVAFVAHLAYLGHRIFLRSWSTPTTARQSLPMKRQISWTAPSGAGWYTWGTFRITAYKYSKYIPSIVMPPSPVQKYLAGMAGRLLIAMVTTDCQESGLMDKCHGDRVEAANLPDERVCLDTWRMVIRKTRKARSDFCGVES